MIEEVRLNNGIHVIHTQNTFSKVGHLGVFINVGTRDEAEDEAGMAHFLEHVLFKGTVKRKPFHILSALDSVGGELNAYTNKEETCIYASFPDEFLKKSVDLISDILLHSVFPPVELEKEKEVVIDEINSYKDAPSELIFDEFDNLVFQNHNLANDVLGSEESVKTFTQAMVAKFVAKHYVAQNMVISSVGNYSITKLVKLLEQYFEPVNKAKPVKKRNAPSVLKPCTKTVAKQVFQTHSILGNLGFGAHHPQKIALLMLNNILGGPAMNSRLNLNVREKYGMTYMLESNCAVYSDCGTFSVYFGTDEKHAKKVERLIQKEIIKLCEKPLGILQLSQSKKQIKGQLAISMENNLGVMLSQGKSKLLYDKVDTIDEVLQAFDKVTAQQLMDVGQQVMHPNHLFNLTYKS